MNLRLRRKTRLILEQLEDRLTPASFNLYYSGTALTINQATPLTGASDTLNIVDNSSAAAFAATPGTAPANTIVLIDAGAGGTTTTANTPGITNVTVNLLPNAAAPTARTVTYDLSSAGRPGNLSLNLNTGAQSLDMNDNLGTGSVQGNLSIRAGAGSDTITTASGAGPLGVDGSMSINLGAGSQTITLGNTTIADNLTLNSTPGSDAISLGAGAGQTFSVGGNANFSTGNGNNTLALGFAAIGTATISGNLYASNLSFFSIASGSSVGGNTTLNAGTRSISYAFNSGSDIGGNVSITVSGSAPLASSSLNFAGAIQNSLNVTLGNTANDTVSDSGSVGGSMNITGGNFGKTITLSSTATVGANFNARLGNGVVNANIVSITAGAQIGNNLYVTLGNTSNAGGNLLDLSGALIGGSVTAFGGSGADTYRSTSASNVVTGPTLVGGNVYLSFGPGPNVATISGTVGGSSISFLGGPGNDTLTINAISFASIYIDLGVAPAGSTKTVNLGVRPKSLYLNFGVGTGSKALNLSGTATPMTYPATILNA